MISHIICDRYHNNNQKMGNTQRQSRDLKVHIVTEFPYYNSNSAVRGVVYIQVLENLVAETLHLRMQGEESCEWIEGGSHNRKRHRQKNIFFKFDHILEKFDNNYVHKGRYAWPFQFDLPVNLPGTYIDYQLTVYLIQYAIPRSLLQYSREIYLREPFRQSLSTVSGTCTSQPLRQLCCSSGEVTLKLVLTKNVCFIGEALGVEVGIDNTRSKHAVKEVVIRLIQNVFMKEDARELMDPNQLQGTRTFKKILQTWKVQGAPAGDIVKTEEFLQINPDKVKHPTAIASVVACYYVIQAQTMTSGVCVINQPIVNATLFLMERQPAKHQKQTKIQQSTEIKTLQLLRLPRYSHRPNILLNSMNTHSNPLEQPRNDFHI